MGLSPSRPDPPSHPVTPCFLRRGLLQRLATLAGLAPWTAHPQAAAAPALCGNGPHPAYPAPDRPALVQSWLQDGRQDGPPPDCSGLPGREFELLVRITAAYADPGDLDAQLARVGRVSALKGASYWSFSDRKRLVLFQEAYAVDQPASLRQRADFSPAELRSGAELYFVHSDNRSSHLLAFGLRLHKITPESFEVQIENLTEMRFMGWTLVASREMQWSVAVERLGPGRWGYRSLLGLRHLRLGRAEQHRLSNLSRSVAMFDLLAGRQTDIEAYR